MKKMFKASVGISALAFMMFSSTAYAAPTDTTVAEVSIQSGQLSLTAPAPNVTFSPITVDGNTHVRNVGFSNPLIVEDLTGTGAGWNVTVQASQFVETNGTAGLDLPTNSLRLQSPVSISPSAQAPAITGPAPWTIDGGAVKILSAVVNDGMGTYNINFSAANALQLSVDTSGPVVDVAANPTVYESTITWQVSTGP